MEDSWWWVPVQATGPCADTTWALGAARFLSALLMPTCLLVTFGLCGLSISSYPTDGYLG